LIDRGVRVALSLKLRSDFAARLWRDNVIVGRGDADVVVAEF
jgi:hypothetical protein